MSDETAETIAELVRADAERRRGIGERTAIYRLYDADDALLYVGITKNTARRWKQHKQMKSWWPRVARRDVAWLDSRPDALLAEHRAIVAESPRHNSLHDPQGLLPGTKKPQQAGSGRPARNVTGRRYHPTAGHLLRLCRLPRGSDGFTPSIGPGLAQG